MRAFSAALFFGAVAAEVVTKDKETDDWITVGDLASTTYTYWYVEDSAKPLEITWYETWDLLLYEGEFGKAQWWWCNQKEKKEGSDLIECNLYMYDAASSSIQCYALWVAPTVPDKVTDSVEPSTILLQGAEI